MNTSSYEIDLAEIKRLISEGQFDYAQFECTRFVANNAKAIMPCCLMSYILYLQKNFTNSSKYALRAYNLLIQGSDCRDILSVSNALLMVCEEKLAVEVMSLLVPPQILDNRFIEEIAKQYGKMDEFDNAIRYFELAAGPEMTYHSWQMYGVALLYKGDQNAAIEKFKKAIEINPLDCISYNELSAFELDEDKSVRIDSLEKLLSNESLDSVNSSYGHFALFNEYDDSNDTKMAFKHLQKANAIRSTDISYDSTLERKLYNSIIEQFAEVEIASAYQQETQQNEPTPVFIVGMPRTGTTLLEKILSRYSQVHSCGELRTMRLQLQNATGIMLNSPNDIGNARNLSALDYNLVGNEYLRNVLWRTGDARFFTDKHPSNNVFLGMIAKALPNARIIHITKNPMDACFSNFKKFFSLNSYTYSYNLNNLAEYYANYRHLMNFWEAKLPAHILQLKYEDLVLDTEYQAERIRTFCGMSQQIETNKAFITNTLSAAQVRKPIHAGNINAWAKYAEYLKPLREQLDDEYVKYMSEIDGVEIL